jgi:hypothetical protein
MIKSYIIIFAATALAIAAATQGSLLNANAQNMTSAAGGAAAQNQTGATPDTTSMTATNFTAQKTVKSTVDTLPGHQMHQAAVILPQRTDGKIWVGTLTWAASDPVEIRLLHNYNSSIRTDTKHTSTPVTTPFAQGESALSLIIPANQGVATLPHYFGGSMNFAASQVAFHNIGGTPFIVTYSVDAEAKSPTS